MTELLCFCLTFMTVFVLSLPANAQQRVYCLNHHIADLSWSPDGELLAVMTLHGLLLYDTDLSLIRYIEAPVVSFDRLATSGPVWSWNGEWVILPERNLPELAIQFESGWSIANAQTGELMGMENLSVWNGAHHVEEVVWSPNNQYVLALRKELHLQMQYPHAELVVVSGIDNPHADFIPQSYHFEELLDMHDIRWDSTNLITARTTGLMLFIDATTFNLRRDHAARLLESWWVSNHNGTYDAGQKPNFTFAVREFDQAEQSVLLSMTSNADGDDVLIPQVVEIIWLPDDEHLMGLYPVWDNGQQPELEHILQGSLIHAPSATEVMHFVLQADGAIDGYAVSSQGDRIALFRDETWLELWNPMTEERLGIVDVPALPIGETC